MEQGNPRIKLAVMGETGVGKSAIIKRFSGQLPRVVQQCYQQTCGYDATSKTKKSCISSADRTSGRDLNKSRLRYKPGQTSIVASCACRRQFPVKMTLACVKNANQTTLVHVSLMEIPKIDFFPEDGLKTWDCEEIRGLNCAKIFILVFDVTKPSTYAYVSQIREEILQNYRKKHESIDCVNRTSLATPTVKNKKNCSGVLSADAPTIIMVGNKCDLIANYKCDARNLQSRNICSMTKRPFKYKECSAKLNYNIDNVFSTAIRSANGRSETNSQHQSGRNSFINFFSCFSKSNS